MKESKIIINRDLDLEAKRIRESKVFREKLERAKDLFNTIILTKK